MNEPIRTNVPVSETETPGRAMEPADVEQADAMIRQILAELNHVVDRNDMPEEDEPLGVLTREFFYNNWLQTESGFLTKTDRIRVTPATPHCPQVFDFEFDCPFKRKRPGEPVEIAPGPVRGRITYRGDMLVRPKGPVVAVQIDRTLGYWHPNYHPERGFLCLGELDEGIRGPVPLDVLLENHLFPIISYQRHRPSHPACIEAAIYFATDPEALTGLDPEPLY